MGDIGQAVYILVPNMGLMGSYILAPTVWGSWIPYESYLSILAFVAIAFGVLVMKSLPMPMS